MIEPSEYMGAYWQVRRQSFDEYLSFSAELLQGVCNTFKLPCFLRIMSSKGGFEVEIDNFMANRDDIARVILDSHVKYADIRTKPQVYDLFSPIGFTSIWELKTGCGEAISITINGGAYGDCSPGNSVVVKVNSRKASSGRDLQRVRTIWNFLIHHCRPDSAVYTSKDLDRKIDPSWKFDKGIGWISFFNTALDSLKVPIGFAVKQIVGCGWQIEVPENLIGVSDDALIDSLKDIQSLLLSNGTIRVDEAF